MATNKKVQYRDAVLPADYTEQVVYALQALQNGKATEGQQQLALKWIVESACEIYEHDYRPDPRDHAYVSGKRGVGLQIVKLCNLNMTKMMGKLGENK